MAATGTTEEEAEKLAQVLKNNQSLEILDVSFNKIGNKGALALLRSRTGLKQLSLRATFIDDGFTKAFSDSRRIQEVRLNLAQNLITEEGALAIFEIANVYSLKSLLIGNLIRDKAVRQDLMEVSDIPTMEAETQSEHRPLG